MATLFGEHESKLLGNKKSFERRNIEKFRGKYRDVQLVEKAIYVLEYLSQLRSVGLNPLFRGGSATQFMLPTPIRRLSIDLDIATSQPKKLLECMKSINLKFDKKFFDFTKDRRPGLHYRITTPTYYTPGFSGFFLLDVFEKEPKYKTRMMKLKTEYYESNARAKIPTVNSMLGDKLSTLGLRTIGLHKNRPSMEQSKQLYDTIQLLDHATDFRDIYDAYSNCFKIQVGFRGLKICLDDALDDLTYTLKLFVISQPTGALPLK